MSFCYVNAKHSKSFPSPKDVDIRMQAALAKCFCVLRAALLGNLQDRLWGPKLRFFRFFGRFGTFPRPFDLSTEGVALSHQGACIREVRNFCHWASCRDPNLLNWDLGRTSPWTPMESTDPLNSGGCDSSRLGSPNGRSCKLPTSCCKLHSSQQSNIRL